MDQVLVVSATEAEAAGVPADLPTLICGIGKVPAATALTRTLARWPSPQLPLVVNVGTAGALRPGLSGLWLPSAVVNHEMNVTSIEEMGIFLTARYELPEGDGSVLATGDVFVTDTALRDRLAVGAQLVDMEGFALAHVCAEFGAKLRIVKHISDEADERATSWPEKVAESAAQLGEWLRERFSSGRSPLEHAPTS
ncbi:MAG: nucleosidase [Segniliparus sp.]|uniref:nucleosidase n=1 Tax=Segniliparus sp. TaxID=2804064 RepID=UPI003F2EC55D